MTDRLDEHSRRELLAYRMQRAVETLEEADCLAGNGLYSGAINRLYYACYYAVSALLIANGHQVSTHAGVKNMFGLKFVKSGLVELSYGKFFNEMFELRHSNDYDDFVFCDEETFTDFRPKAEGLIEVVRNLMK